MKSIQVIPSGESLLQINYSRFANDLTPFITIAVRESYNIDNIIHFTQFQTYLHNDHQLEQVTFLCGKTIFFA